MLQVQQTKFDAVAAESTDTTRRLRDAQEEVG